MNIIPDPLPKESEPPFTWQISHEGILRNVNDYAFFGKYLTVADKFYQEITPKIQGSTFGLVPASLLVLILTDLLVFAICAVNPMHSSAFAGFIFTFGVCFSCFVVCCSNPFLGRKFQDSIHLIKVALAPIITEYNQKYFNPIGFKCELTSQHHAWIGLCNSEGYSGEFISFSRINTV